VPQHRGQTAADDLLFLTEAYRTDVRPLLAQIREELGVPTDPVAAYKASGYEQKIRAERGVSATSGGFQ
jgi:L-rhamnose isomerase/sugar isomerase